MEVLQGTDAAKAGLANAVRELEAALVGMSGLEARLASSEIGSAKLTVKAFQRDFNGILTDF